MAGIEFCSECGAIVMGKKGEEVNCPSCGTPQKASNSIKLSEKVVKKEEKEIVSTDKTAAEIHPLMDFECPKCGNGKAYFWTKQTRSGDEPETQFFKCNSCSNQWRNYQ